MKKYINGGIVKELTLHLKKDEDLNEVIKKISELVNLDLYDMKRVDNAIYFELSDDFIKRNIASFFREIDCLKIIPYVNYSNKATYIENNIDVSLNILLDKCDDVIKERFRCFDTFSINDSDYYLDILCYVYYFDGPYGSGNFKDLVKCLHIMQRGVLSNPLRDTLCFGMSS